MTFGKKNSPKVTAKSLKQMGYVRARVYFSGRLSGKDYFFTRASLETISSFLGSSSVKAVNVRNLRYEYIHVDKIDSIELLEDVVC